MLVNFNDILADAKKNKYGVGLFNTVNLEMAKGVLAAAEELGAKAVSVRPLANAVHIFTHIEWHMTGYLVECEALPEGMAQANALEIGEKYAIPKAFRAYTDMIENFYSALAVT